MNWKRLQRSLPLVLLLAVPLLSRGAFEAYLRIDGMEGEATDFWHTNWIVALSVTNDLVRQPSPLQPEASVTSDIVIVKEVDKASPKLYLACAKGQLINAVKLEFCLPSGGQITFYEINLSNAVVRLMEQEGIYLGPHGRPMERAILTCEGLSWTYTRFGFPSGLPVEYRTSHWDLLHNTGGSSARAAAFKVTGIQRQAGEAVLSWLPAAGTTYRIFSSPQVDGAFSLLAEVTPTGDTVTTYSAPIVGGAWFFAVEEKH